MIRYTRLLWTVSAAAGALAVFVAFTGGGTLYLGPLRLSAHSFKNAHACSSNAQCLVLKKSSEIWALSIVNCAL